MKNQHSTLRKTSVVLVFAMAATLITILGSSGAAEAATFYRLPLQYVPWNITYWMDHWRVPYAANANVRYDGTAILPGSPYYYGVNPRHRGTDFGAPVGSPVYAAASGTVREAISGCAVGNTTCGGAA